MKEVRVDMAELGPDPLSKSLMVVVAHSMRGGVKSPGDTMDILIPSGIEMSLREGQPLEEIGEWQITVKKVS